MADQAVEVVGQIGEGQFGLGPRDTDSSDEKAEPGLLVPEDLLDDGVTASALSGLRG